MLFALAVLSAAVYVPFGTTTGSTIPTLTKEELEEIRPGGNFTFALGLSEDDAKSGTKEKAFLSAAIHFHGKARFAIIESESATKIAKEQSVELTAIFVYISGFLMGSYPYPDTDVAVLYLIDEILNQLPPPAKTMTELCATVGPSPFVEKYAFCGT